MGAAVVAWLLAILFGALVRARRRRIVLVPFAVVLLGLALAAGMFAALA
jgi:hypothetical protein